MTKEQRNTLIVAMTTAFITTFMGSSLNLAIPNIEADFGVGAALVGWVVTAYMLATSSLNVLAGKIADMKGRRWMIICGIGIFAVASLIAVFSKNIWMLLAMRLLQGLAAAMIFATNNAILISAFPASQRGSVLGKSTAAALGRPADGSLLTESDSFLRQHHLKAEERKVFGMRFQHTGKDLSGQTVLLIDDVLTTGSTMRRCTELLLQSGAARVFAATAACRIRSGKGETNEHQTDQTGSGAQGAGA